MRGACAADDPWHGYRQKFRVFFREACCPTEGDDHAPRTALSRRPIGSGRPPGLSLRRVRGPLAAGGRRVYACPAARAGRRHAGWGVSHGQLLHPAPHRCHRHRHPDGPARGLHPHRAVVRAVPVPRPPDDPRDGHLPRRLRGVRGAVGGDPHRAGSQWRRSLHLLEVVEHERRPHAPRGLLRGRGGSRHRQCPHPEPGVDGAGAPAARGHAAGGHRQEAEPQHPAGDRALFASGVVRRQLPHQLREY